MQRLSGLILLMGVLALSACGSPSVDNTSAVSKRSIENPVTAPSEVTQLANSIMALGAGVDPEEARRAAEIAYSYTDELAIQYQITDSPLVHNSKVNMGLKPRGLCWHWAEDMERRLKQENFQTLELHRAIANHDKAFRIEHSTALISRKGDSMYEAIVLDPWRKGGELYWSEIAKDTRYEWHPREEVLALKRAEAAAKAKTN